jgi:hypothetical protein
LMFFSRKISWYKDTAVGWKNLTVWSFIINCGQTVWILLFIKFTIWTNSNT